MRLFDGVYPNIGMRHLADIDILVPDQQFGLAMAKMGYRPADANCQDTYDAMGRPVLPHGAHHLTPVNRPDDPVTIEPLLLATAARYRNMLPPDLTSSAVVVPGCKNLRQPSRKNDLIVNLLHTLLHDRDTLDGGLLLRGLVECELMFARLAAEDQAAVARHFADCGAAKLWTAWRALSDWLFGGDDKALWRSVSGYLLISEFRLRARGYRMVFVISVLHRSPPIERTLSRYGRFDRKRSRRLTDKTNVRLLADQTDALLGRGSPACQSVAGLPCACERANSRHALHQRVRLGAQ